MREAIDVEAYCTALETWAMVADRAEREKLVVREGCAHLRASFSGNCSIRSLCKALAEWAYDRYPFQRLPTGEMAKATSFDDLPIHFSLGGLQTDIGKSCLLNRLIYAGEPLRVRQCPIHKGKWSGLGALCPAGCNFGQNLTGWLP